VENTSLLTSSRGVGEKKMETTEKKKEKKKKTKGEKKKKKVKGKNGSKGGGDVRAGGVMESSCVVETRSDNTPRKTCRS